MNDFDRITIGSQHRSNFLRDDVVLWKSISWPLCFHITLKTSDLVSRDFVAQIINAVGDASNVPILK